MLKGEWLQGFRLKPESEAKEMKSLKDLLEDPNHIYYERIIGFGVSDGGLIETKNNQYKRNAEVFPIVMMYTGENEFYDNFAPPHPDDKDFRFVPATFDCYKVWGNMPDTGVELGYDMGGKSFHPDWEHEYLEKLIEFIRRTGYKAITVAEVEALLAEKKPVNFS